MATLPYLAPIGPDQNRYIFATYSDTTKYNDKSFDTMNSTDAFQAQLEYLSEIGYVGDPGNNIYS